MPLRTRLVDGDGALIEASNPLPVVSTISVDPLGAHTRNASLSSAVTLSIPDGARLLIVQALAQNVRMTLSATSTPTATVGFRLTAGDPPLAFPVGENSVFKFIEETSGAEIQYQFE